MTSARENRLTRLDEALRVYVLTDRELSRGRSEVDIVRQAIAGGATAIQLRWKQPSMYEALEIARELRAICRDRDVLFVVNDRVDLAMAANADGVHVGEDDLPVAATRSLVGESMIIGYSPPTIQDAVLAELDRADYLGVGPVFGTATKSDAGEAVGTGRIAEVSRQVQIPIVGIGGINALNASEVVAAGATGVAVISAVVSQEDVSVAARELRQAVDGVRERSS